MVDVDHFKLYNDTYGHAAGDAVLRMVAQTLRGALKRSSDFVARYGGEEFVILLPEVGQAGAQGLAEQVRQEIEGLRIRHQASPVAPWVTISLGGATAVPQEAQEEPELFCTADASLYQAKHGGRNRVAWALSGQA